MGKQKKAKGKSDKILAKRGKPVEKKLNPFELHINKEKHATMNRRRKEALGNPGQSRHKAFKIRQETIGAEYKRMNRRNEFKDGRRESNRQHKRTAIFNLNDEEVLTHKGQTLQEIERFEAPEQDFDEEEDARLNAEYTEAAHFGNGEDEPKDRKSAIEELIAESKKLKQERTKENEAVFELTQTLDAYWKNLVPLVDKISRGDVPKEKPDDYDKAMRELIFEKRGEPTNPLKSAEEMERMEQERVRRLEQERKRRMEEQEEGPSKPKHRSADDLDDGYFQDEVAEEDERMVAYDIDAGEAPKGADDQNGDAGDQNDASGDENEASGDENEASGDENEASGDEKDENEAEEAEESQEEGSEEGSEEEEDNLEDLKDDESESESENEAPESQKTDKKVSKDDQKPLSQTIFRIPSTYPEFADLLSGKTASERGAVVESMLKNVQLFVASSRKGRLVSLFAFLLQHINDLFSEDADPSSVRDNFRCLNKLVPHLYTLNQQYPQETSQFVLEVVKEKQEYFRKRPKFFPQLSTVVFLKVVSVLFSTSDFRHPIVTPCVVFLSHILSKARIVTSKDVALGLFLCTVYLEFCQLSRRFLPAVLNFLNGVVYLSVRKRPVEPLRVVPPFKKGSNFLALDRKSTFFGSKLDAEDLVSKQMSDEFKVKALGTALGLLQEYLKTYEESCVIHTLAQNSLDVTRKLDKDFYAPEVQNIIDATVELCDSLQKRKVAWIQEPTRRPKALRLLEPKIDRVYDGGRKQVTSQVRAEREKLVQKIRREKKGAMREIRRDNEFLTKMKLKRQFESDKIRKQKVKELMSDAFAQQGELKAMARKRERK